MTELQKRIDELNAIDKRRTQEPFEVRCHEKQRGCYMIDFIVDRRLKGKVWLNGTYDNAFFQRAGDMLKIINEQAEIIKQKDTQLAIAKEALDFYANYAGCTVIGKRKAKQTLLALKLL